MKLPTKIIRRAGKIVTLLMCVAYICGSSLVFAGKADVLDVKVKDTGADIYRFSVTVRHGDEGWDHYADRWDVLDETGTVLGTRVLMHPHDNEQPFTRSMTLSVPMHVKRVLIRARDKEHGYGGAEVWVDLPN